VQANAEGAYSALIELHLQAATLHLALTPMLECLTSMLISLTWCLEMSSQKALRSVNAANRRSGLLGVCAAIGVVAVLTTALTLRVSLAEGPPPKAPLTVSVVTFVIQDSYRRTASFLGVVNAGMKANLGFQLPGLIATPPPRGGTPVKRGETIASLDKTALILKRKATAADLEQATIELDLAQLKAARQQKLVATGAVSKELSDETRLRALARQSRVDAIAARLASIDDELLKSRLIAPYVHQGAVISAGTPVVRLVGTADQESHVGVPAALARELKPGDVYSLKLRDNTVKAKLLSVRPDVDPVTRTATAIFALPRDLDALDGEPITLELEQTVRESGGWLPISALLEGSHGVWTVLRITHEGNTARTVREAVEVLDIRGDKAYVRGTLPGNVLIVASGVHRLSPGSPVSVADVN
jgi:RND family efflux transporter MFP subunit